jgi:hypothetical protein
MSKGRTRAYDAKKYDAPITLGDAYNKYVTDAIEGSQALLERQVRFNQFPCKVAK